ncbi:UDP-N-acetylmuramoylalanyl-D-glutamate--2,6-diaminopimelate ligase [hydrothermal vent metagenome]|uniref:UDP-N-acetylmuramoylalanyl-D-glutamate--2,6-diaminopimelate ligase n=1 Tax=hydrothermal vent metagenome TaxID=652676 RepID=A0A3B0XHM9_9ZZZZ
MMQNEIALDYLLEGFIDDVLIDQCRGIAVNAIVQDNRKARSGNLFIAHQGYNTHGLLYAQDAVAKGVSVILWDGDLENRNEILDSISNKVLCIQCQDLKYKVGPIASRYYEQPSLSLNVIGVTGTDGKTSIAHFLAQCLDAYDVHCGVLGTLGNGFINDLHPTGLTTVDALLVQKTLADIQQAGAKHVVMEVSSHGLDQGRVNGVAFTTAVLSNMAVDHLDYHGTVDNYAAAKRRLFYTPGLSSAVINLDDEFGRKLAKEVREHVCVWGYSLEKDVSKYQDYADYFVAAQEIKPFERGTHLSIITPKGESCFDIPLLGRFNVSNALAVLSTLLISQFSLENAIRSLTAIRSVDGRVEIIAEDDKPVVVVDYAHTEQGLAAVSRSMRDHFSGKIWCVFGCGGDRDRSKRPLMAKVAEEFADKIIVTTDNPRHENPQSIIDEVLTGFSSLENVEAILDRRQAIDVAISNAQPGDVVLLAGKGHETSQIVGDVHIAFDDRRVAREFLTARESGVLA